MKTLVPEEKGNVLQLKIHIPNIRDYHQIKIEIAPSEIQIKFLRGRFLLFKISSALY